jgi:hypothetical protein
MAEGTLVVWDRYGGNWRAEAAPGGNTILFTNIQPGSGKQMSLERLELPFWFEPDDIGKLLALIQRLPAPDRAQDPIGT